MPQLAANISTMFREWAFVDRIQAAADVGFQAVECQFPYDHTVDDLANALHDAGLSIVLLNTPGGGEETGGLGLGAVPDQVSACRDGIQQALDYCRALNCRQVHLMAGIRSDDILEADSLAVLVENTRYAADLFAPHNIQVLLEPINNHDISGYSLNRIETAVVLIGDIGRENVGLQFDVYHTVRMGDDPGSLLLQYREQIRHIQISGCPGRHEPDVGDIDYPPLFATMDEMGYAGWVGCEYTPQRGTLAGLDWAHDLGITG